MTEYIGSTYTGKLDHNGKWTGQGELVYANGIKYTGTFSDGQFHGEGILHFTNGGQYKSVWKNGIEQQSTSSYQWNDGLPYNLHGDWEYITPFDHRLWPEHRDHKRADIGYIVHPQKNQTVPSTPTDSTTGSTRRSRQSQRGSSNNSDNNNNTTTVRDTVSRG